MASTRTLLHNVFFVSKMYPKLLRSPITVLQKYLKRFRVKAVTRAKFYKERWKLYSVIITGT